MICLLNVWRSSNMINTVSEINNLWTRVLERLSEIIDKHIFESFFNDSSIYRLAGDEMTIAVNSDFAASIISSKYIDQVSSTINDVTESNFKIEIISKTKIPLMESEKSDEKKQVFFANSKLNPKYTFDSFVVGASNREASQAALMIASEPGKFYNPLFIYSQSGLGKTHLLHAIGHFVRDNQPRLRVLYISTDDFVDEFIRYVHAEKDSESLKDFFKNIDVLLVDDIQFLADKRKTEEMFFFIFNALVNAGKQIVLTSDRHPSELKGLEDRLVTRFSSGLIINMTKPDSDMMIAILKKKIEANNLDVSRFDPEVLSFFAEKFPNNVRELEGALNRLLFYTINMKQSQHVDLNLAVESVSSLLGSKARGKDKLDTARILNEVADYYNLTPSQLTGKIRTSQISLARHMAIYLCRSLLDMPFAKIGEQFGGKDHSTIMSAVKKVENQLKTNVAYQQAVSDLKKRLSSKN